ncbi:probable protein phosphatase 2C 6 isoform X1 [Gossypium hirsutum]|uniref:protein-serine/threonine phosphatase n=2 Tax=Gossypium TaxID=3633 RepID=A0ABM2Z0Y6_GOSHI|nr:probable protein phosphatase 2C 6 isoform X1 [Gossypium hirsutum]
MATESTVMNEQTQTLLQKDTTITADNSSSPKPMDSNSSSATTLVLSSHLKGVEAGSSAVVVITGSGSSSSDTKGNDIAGVEGQRTAPAKHCIGKSNKGVSWGFSLDQGRRSTMEDRAVVQPGFMKLCCKDVGGCRAPECEYAMEKSLVHYFGIFDGHGGDQVSNYCAKELCGMVAEEWEGGSSLEGWNKRWEVALCKAYERADNAFKDEALAPKSVGSTALVLIVSPCQIIAANCGDSRAVLCRGAQATPLTVDQKPDRADESERITSSGGRILNWGCLRVEGILSMSRAIGDHDLKPWVISVPEVTFTTRTKEDECLILASDGLWDVLSNDDVVKLARKELKQRQRLAGANKSSFPPAWHVSQHVIKQALDAYSLDNISVIVVDLKNPKLKPQEKP